VTILKCWEKCYFLFYQQKVLPSLQILQIKPLFLHWRWFKERNIFFSMHFKTDVIFWLNLVLNIRSHKWHFWQKNTHMQIHIWHFTKSCHHKHDNKAWTISHSKHPPPPPPLSHSQAKEVLKVYMTSNNVLSQKPHRQNSVNMHMTFVPINAGS